MYLKIYLIDVYYLGRGELAKVDVDTYVVLGDYAIICCVEVFDDDVIDCLVGSYRRMLTLI